MAWTHLLLAGLFEIGFALGLKHTDGFTRLWPSLGTAAAAAASLYLMTLAMQHGMVWVGLGMMPPREPGAPNELNRLGAFIGVMAQAGNVPPELEPPHGDLETGRAYGVRIATMARRHRG